MKKIVLFISFCGLFFLTACTKQETKNEGSETDRSTATRKSSDERILIAYFSYYDNKEANNETDVDTSASVVEDKDQFLGTNEYVAKMIQNKIGGTIHSIKVQEPYPEDFEETRTRNHQEMDENTLPKLVSSSLDMNDYDTVLLGYPVWATAAPQAIFSFLSDHELEGKKIIPFCTHDGYGSGSSFTDIEEQLEQSDVLEGLAIESSEVKDAAKPINSWLEELDISPANSGETPINMSVNGQEVEAFLYESALAKEIYDQIPLEIEMTNYGGREIYGSLADFIPTDVPEGQLTFENGDITYCKSNNTLAIFYAQTDRPDLTMEVVPIGKVTSDLKTFTELPSSVTVTLSK